MRKQKTKFKKENGITLIALVITIIVLLILAGVSIAMLTGQNGILTQANNAKVEQSHGAVKEGISLAYNEYQIEINTASNEKIASTKTVTIKGEEEKALASYSSFLDFLNSKGYIKEGTTDVLNVEKLTGGKQALGNGVDTDVYKIEKQDNNYVVNYYDNEGTPEEIWSIANNQSSADNVEINITRTNLPNDQNVVEALLIVDKVLQNGSEIQTINVTEEEYKNMLLQKLETMTDEEKESLFVNLINNSKDGSLADMHFNDINEFIEYVYNQGEISENSKDAFYELIGGKENFEVYLAEVIYLFDYNLIGEYDKETGELPGCIVKNPDGENSNIYLATQNGDYTFTVEIGNKEYVKTVNVNNIKENQEDEIDCKVEQDKDGAWYIRLRDIENNNYTNFSEAYLINDGKLINVSNEIKDYEADGVVEIDAFELAGTIGLEYMDGTVTRTIILNKYGNYYIGEINIHAEG